MDTVSQCTVTPSRAGRFRARAGDRPAAATDSAIAAARAGECLPRKPSIPENVLPHDLHMYRCSVFCLHLRLPYLMNPSGDSHPRPGHLLGILPIRTLPRAPSHALRMVPSTATACMQSCLPAAAPPHGQTGPAAHSTTVCHSPLTDCDSTSHFTELFSLTAPGASAICRPLSRIPLRIPGSLLLFPLFVPPAAPPFRAGRPGASGAPPGLNPHSVSLRCCRRVCPIFRKQWGITARTYYGQRQNCHTLW